MQASTIVVSAGLAIVGMGAALCLTPITSLAMTAVPAERSGMASGIMGTQRALVPPSGSPCSARSSRQH